MNSEHLLEPMLLSIWELSGGTAYKPVPLREVLRLTLDKLGVEESTSQIPMTGPKSWSFYLRQTFRAHMEGLSDDKPSYVALHSYGKWCLTPLGVQHVESGNPDLTPEDYKLPSNAPNETSLWISKNGAEVLKYLSKYLPGLLKKSAMLGSIDDHIQTFMVKIVANNALKPYISTDKKIHMSMLCSWCVKSAYSEMTSMGQEPVERIMRNAKTETELVVEKTLKKTDGYRDPELSFNDDPFFNKKQVYSKNIVFSDTEGSESSFDGFDLVSDQNYEDSILTSLSFNTNYSLIRESLQKSFQSSKDYDLALRVFDDYIFTNKTVQEIASDHNASKAKIYTLLNRIRQESLEAKERLELEV